ncbi:hypothetical protein ABZ383_27155 [Streptomyces sp. NPDC005900]|uniref:hypothetical protein n=1 Tax=Streptomyces sp. NPDC005900 TaxID=3154569 RepID=UPI00340DB696
MHSHRRPACVASPPRGQLDGRQTVIVIVVLVAGIALALTGMPVVVIAQVLATCGLIGAQVARRAPAAPPAPAAPEGL